MAGEKVINNDITIFKFLVSDHLNCLNTIACQPSTALYATAKTRMYTPIFAKLQTGVLWQFSRFELLLLVQNSTYVAQILHGLSYLNLESLSHLFLFWIYPP